jgi:hypothetical protein
VSEFASVSDSQKLSHTPGAVLLLCGIEFRAIEKSPLCILAQGAEMFEENLRIVLMHTSRHSRTFPAKTGPSAASNKSMFSF